MNMTDYRNNNTNDNTKDIIENYYQPRNINSSTYPMYYCPLCNYSMPMRDEYDNSDDSDDSDQDEYVDPGYRQRRPRRRRPRRRRRYPYYPQPYAFPYIFPYFFPYGGYEWDDY